MSKMRSPSAFSNAADRLIGWATHHPKTILIIAAVITAVAVSFLPMLRVDVDFANYLNRNDPAVIAADQAKARFGSQIRTIVAIEDSQGVFGAATLKLVEELEAALDALPEVNDMVGPLSAQVIRGTQTSLQIRSAAPNGVAPQTPEDIEAYRVLVLSDNSLFGYVVSSTETALAIYLEQDPSINMITFAAAVEDVVSSFETEGISFSIAGLPYANLTLQRSMKTDLRLFLPLVILIIIGVLFVSFRWTWGILIPFAVVSLSVLWVLGLMAMTGVPITVLSFILPILLMAIGIADGIHVLSRYREELRRQDDKQGAILATMKAMKRPVVLTSLTTAIGFLSLLYAYMIPQRTFGLFTAIGILAAMLLSLLLIPAILQMVKAPALPKREQRHGRLGRMLGIIVCWATRMRWVVLIGAVVLSGVFAAGIPLLQIETSQRAYLGEGHPAVLSMDRLDELFSGSSQVMIEIDSGKRDGLKSPALLREMVGLEEFLRAHGVNKTMSLSQIVREMNQRFHADDPDFYAIPDDQSTIAQLLLLFSMQGGSLGALSLSDFSAGEVMGFHALKTGEEQIALVEDVSAYLEENFEGVSVQMAGPTRIQASMFTSIARSQLTSLLTSIFAAGVIVILLMRSFSSGIVSMIPLLFTVLFNFGVMAFAGKSLDIATLMISSITIGIGIDYGIHFIERVREEMPAAPTRVQALVHAAQTTGTGIVYNALALALGFGIMMLSAFQGLQNFGLLIAMTMVVSAMGAFVVIPALMAGRSAASTSTGNTAD